MDPRTAKMLSERGALNPSPGAARSHLRAQIASWLSAVRLQAVQKSRSADPMLRGLDLAGAIQLYVFSLIAVSALDDAIHESTVWWAAVILAVVLRITYVTGGASKNLEQ
jgi:hypothetical protein